MAPEGLARRRIPHAEVGGTVSASWEFRIQGKHESLEPDNFDTYDVGLGAETGFRKYSIRSRPRLQSCQR